METIVDGGRVRPLTRGGLDATRYFGSFLEPPTWIAARQAIVDGEVIAVDEAGEPDFARLQAGIKGELPDGRGSHPFLYVVFDLLFVDGRSLLAEPLEERRRLLAEALRPDPRVRFSEHIERDGVAAFAAAKERGSRGSWRRTGDPVRTWPRTLTWQKIKIRPEQELVVGGWTTGIGAATDLGALLVGVYDDG